MCSKLKEAEVPKCFKNKLLFKLCLVNIQGLEQRCVNEMSFIGADYTHILRAIL
jgi:hypothetical protein